MTTARYSVTPNGKDTADCLQQNNGSGSCKTVTFIIRNECQPDKRLHIKLMGNNTYREPCWETPTVEMNGKVYPCFITLFGDESENRPLLTCVNSWTGNKSISTNIMSQILEYSPSTMQGCNVHKDTHECSCRAMMTKGMVFRYTWVYSKEDTMAHTRRLMVTS